MAHFDSIDLRTDKRKWFVCSVSLCGRFGDETVRVHENMEAAQKSLEWINKVNCGANCCKLHYIVEIPYGHVKNIKSKSYYKSCGYLRWLITSGIVPAIC
jgi:hypothetical protein